MLRPTKPTISLRRLFSLGVRIRTTFSFDPGNSRPVGVSSCMAGRLLEMAERRAQQAPFNGAVSSSDNLITGCGPVAKLKQIHSGTNRGRPSRKTWGALALTRVAQWEEREQQDDYTKRDSVVNK